MDEVLCAEAQQRVWALGDWAVRAQPGEGGPRRLVAGLRIVGDWTFALLFRRDIVAFGSVTEAPTLARTAAQAQANPPPSTDGESSPEGRHL